MWTHIPTFRAHRAVRGGHAQTVAGAYFFHGGHQPQPAEMCEVEVSEGDKIVLHDLHPPGWKAVHGTVLLVHGLCGCYESGYMRRTAAKLAARGVRSFRMDLRGSGAGFHLARKTYHAGRSDDALAAVRFIAERCPGAPLVLVGFSMGGNIALKLAGEVGAKPPAGLRAVIAAAPPVNLAYCAQNLQRGLNRVYDQSFLRALLRLWKRRREMDAGPYGAISRTPRSLFEFDDKITAPMAGFADAHDYYTQCSAAPLLEQIHLPTLIFTAADDPLIPADMFDTPVSDAVQLETTASGGHLGYVGRSGQDSDRRWLDWRIVEQVLAAFS